MKAIAGFLMVAVALTTILALAGCAAPASPAAILPTLPLRPTQTPAPAMTPSAAARKYTYADMVLCFPQQLGDGDEGYWRAVETASFQETAARLGIKELVSWDAQERQESQILDVRACIRQGVSVIALPPVVESGWDALLAEARNANIPVIIVDHPVDSDPALYAAYIGPNMELEGRRCADEMNQLLPDGGSILELSGATGSVAAAALAAGFREKLHANIKILDSRTGNFTRAESKPVMEAFLKKYAGRFQGVFIHSDEMAIGVIDAIKAAGLKPGALKMVSVGGARPGFQAMVDGWLQADVACDPLLGPQALEMALRLMNGQPVDKEVLADATVYHLDDMPGTMSHPKY